MTGHLKARLAETSPLIQVLVGPRQVGKTTTIRQSLKPNDLYKTADSPTPLSASVLEDWWNEAKQCRAEVLAIDEVQKVPGWSEVVKKLWDQEPEGRRLRLVLSGSAALSIEKNLKESLAGRFELIRAEHWNYAEAKSVFGITLEQYIGFGCYPGSARFLSDTSRWAAYIRDSIVEPAIGRDIMQLHPVEKPALFRQLFALAVGLPAQVVSLHKLQGNLQEKGAVATLQHYLRLLSEGFLVSGVQKYSPAVVQEKKSSPKLIIHDNGLIRAWERPPEQELSTERFGRYFENQVIARFIESGWGVYYWRERDIEVDVVLVGPSGELWAVEIKSNRIAKKELRGLNIFCSRYKQFEPCIISLKDEEVQGYKTLPVERVLSLSRGEKL